MKKYLSFLLFSLILLSGCTQSNKGVTVLNVNEFNEAINLDNVQLVDVRTPEEFEGGHITHAQNINYNSENFGAQIESLDKSKPVYIYCHSGGRSGQASRIFTEKGFTVYDLDGGITAWNTEMQKE